MGGHELGVKNIYNYFILFFKQVIRNPFYILSFGVGMFYLALIVYSYSSTDISNPANMLQLSTYLVQGGMLVFMFLGFYAINNIYANPLYDLYKNRHGNTYMQIVSHVLFVFLANFVFCLFSLILFLITYKVFGYPFSDLYIDSIYFIIVYWFIPFMVSAFMGMILGFFINRKMSVLFITLLWLFISPMNIYLLHSFLMLVGIERFPTFLKFGVEDPRMPYNAYAGFVFESEEIMSKFVWFIVLFIIIGLLVLRHKNKRLINILGLLILVAAAVTFVFLQDNSAPERERNMNELKYYDEYEYTHDYLEYDYEIESYDIDLKVDDQLEAVVQITFKTPVKGEKGISLYHDFKVGSLKNEIGENISYKQKGDMIEVSLKKATKQLTMKYKGDSSVFMVANKNNIYLPYYFSWIPLNSKHNPTMKSINFSNHRLPNHSKSETKYVLRYKGPQPLITNLEKQKDGIYKGTNSSGIYLLHGNLKTRKFDEFNLTFPITWENAINQSEVYRSDLVKAFDYITHAFELNVEKPKNIYFIPASGPNDVLYSEYMWLHPKGLFILHDPYDFFPDYKFSMLTYKSSYQLLGAMLWKDNKLIYEDYGNSTLFTLVSGRYINKQVGIEEPPSSEVNYFIDEMFLFNKDYTDTEITLFNNVISYVNTANQKDVESFLYQWSLLLENPSVSWEHLSDLLNRVEKERKE